MALKLNRGNSFTYDNNRYQITDRCRYTWHDGTKTVEYLASTRTGKLLSFEVATEKNGDVYYNMWKPVRYEEMNRKSGLFPHNLKMTNANTVNKEIRYKGITFHQTEIVKGVCYEFSESNPVVCLSYASRDEKHLFDVEVYEDEAELSYGWPIDESEIKEIDYSRPIKYSGFFLWMKNFTPFLLFIGILSAVVLMSKPNAPRSTQDNIYFDERDSTYKVRSNTNNYRNRSRGYGK